MYGNHSARAGNETQSESRLMISKLRPQVFMEFVKSPQDVAMSAR